MKLSVAVIFAIVAFVLIGLSVVVALMLSNRCGLRSGFAP
jgi:hypothetical protein